MFQTNGRKLFQAVQKGRLFYFVGVGDLSLAMAVAIVGAVGSLLGGLAGYFAHKNKIEKETTRESKEDGANRGVMMTELGYIKAGIDDIKSEQRNQAVQYGQLCERVTRVEESTKSAHHRIDRMEGA